MSLFFRTSVGSAIKLDRTVWTFNPSALTEVAHLSDSLLPAAHGEIGDAVEVRAQHFGVLEELVPEGVEPVQGDEQVSCCHPFLETRRKTKNKWWWWGPTAREGFGKPSMEFTYFLKVEWRRASRWGKCLGHCHSRRQMQSKRSIKWVWF